MRFIKLTIFNVVVMISFSTAWAAEKSVVLNKNGLSGISECQSARTLGKNIFTLSFQGNFAYDPDMISLVSTGRKETQPYAVLYDLYPSIAYGILDFLDISLLQPVYFDLIEGCLPTGSPGDLAINVKCSMPGLTDRDFKYALLSTVTIPYNIKEKGYFIRHSYFLKDGFENIIKPYSCYSSGNPSLSLTGIVSYSWKKLEGHLNTGTVLTFNHLLDNALIGAAGISFHPNERVSFSTGIFYEPRFETITSSNEALDEPFHLSGMITVQTETGAILSAGCKFRLSRGNYWWYSVYADDEEMILQSRYEPLWKAFVEFSWVGGNKTKDRDQDQVSDKNDKCPDVPEDIDAFQDDDGCPDIDNDNDRIPDSYDSCATLAEDMDGYKDSDGCPDFDNDEDLIPDSVDACPNTAEDKDGFEDEDGCEEKDNDSDLIYDAIDKCPNDPEDKDGFEDSDGCPDFDNDQDAIPDSIDRCPDSTGNTLNDGCPDKKAKEIRFGRLILPGVHFEEGLEKLTPEAMKELERLLSSLIDWPDVTVEIQVHTDNSLSPKKSLLLSRKRAKAVCSYLIKNGISDSRLKQVGKGSKYPIADNSAAEGRQLNNRVEIHRIK